MKDKKNVAPQKNKNPTSPFKKRPAGDADDSTSIYKEFLKKEKSIDMEVYAHNLEKISNSRFYSAVLAGVFSGTFCLTGLYGIAFYFLNFILFSIVLGMFLQFQKNTYLLSPMNIFTVGVFTHMMVYVIFWVMFYNLVHIY